MTAAKPVLKTRDVKINTRWNKFLHKLRCSAYSSMKMTFKLLIFAFGSLFTITSTDTESYLHGHKMSDRIAQPLREAKGQIFLPWVVFKWELCSRKYTWDHTEVQAVFSHLTAPCRLITALAAHSDINTLDAAYWKRPCASEKNTATNTKNLPLEETSNLAHI